MRISGFTVMPHTPQAPIATNQAIMIGANNVRSFAYPVTVYRLADSTTIAVVSEVWGNPSPMNLSESIGAAVQQRWPGAHVLERWADGAAGTTPGAGGHFAWSGGNGGHVPADLDDLDKRGLDLRAVAST